MGGDRVDVVAMGEDDTEFTLGVVIRATATTQHTVTLSRADHTRLAAAGESPTEFVARCTAFLLDREENTSILREFDIAVISRYFPEFESEIVA